MKSRTVLITLLAFVFPGVMAQDPPTTPPPQEESAPPARVVGQARSPEEHQAFQAIQQSASDAELARLAQEFLLNYPDSGLTAYVHYALANYHRRSNNTEGFIEEAEMTLQELPAAPDLLAYLAFYYAESGEGDKADARARQAMQVLATAQRPAQTDAAQWALQRFLLNGEAHYALGRTALARATQAGATGEDVNVLEAVKELRRAIEQSPTHQFAAFRLGEALTRQGDLDAAISTYARATALGSVIGGYARQKLETIYTHVHQNTDGMEDLIAQQKAQIDKEVADRESLIESIRQEAVAAQQPPDTPPTPPGTARPPGLN